MGQEFILWYNQINKTDTPRVGGKTSSLGEMINNVNVPIPEFFAITAHAYQHYIEYSGLHEKITLALNSLDVHSIASLQKTGAKIRRLIRNGSISKELETAIRDAYKKFEKQFGKGLYVAVRSSATAEDLPNASFAGQQETYLNVHGAADLLGKVKDCFASLFTNRAISYREDMGFDHFKVFLSVTVQRMIRSDLASSGVAFTLDPDSGFRNVVFINGSWGLGEYIVQGKVTPDEFVVLKPTNTILSKKLGSKKIKFVRSSKGNSEKKVSKKDREQFVLKDQQITQLADYCTRVENHYKRPMDLEWALDGQSHKLYILQARPETVHALKHEHALEHYALKEESTILVRGKAIGRKIGAGNVRVINSAENIHQFKKGEVLVTTMTDPDWEPIMKIASAIVTDLGGSTSHAAIVSRELGVPAIVGTASASHVLKNGQEVTVDCTGGEGRVWKGMLDFVVKKTKITTIPNTKTKIMVNIGEPDTAFDVAQLPVDGVGLAREEFIIANYIGEHPLHMIAQGRAHVYIDKLAEGIAKIAGAFYPRMVTLRLSDFKTNEYRTLKGGEKYEPEEENPMIGWRGASRYINKTFEPAFRLECKALHKVIYDLKLRNVVIMVPFCRTIKEAKAVLAIMASEGLKREKDGLKIIVMAEIPSNIMMVDEFSELFDGFSIGSNDLTQLTLGMSRDSVLLGKEFDERNPAVLRLIDKLIRDAHKNKKYVGICGQAPSDHPEYAKFLVERGIDSISLNPDVALETKLRVAKLEAKR